jgi:FPC/CPF motif-containing protein YcgG
MANASDQPSASTALSNPFDSELAIRHSQYFSTKGGRPVSEGGAADPPDLFASAAIAAFRGFVQNPQFSCVGAKSAVANESARLGVYDRLGSEGATAGLARDLWTFTHDPDTNADNDYVTLVALFKEPTGLDEAGFEACLWKQLSQLRRLDAPLHDWDPTVSPDPHDSHFGFSFAGTAFFVVGLHPNSSREARRFPWPLLVFNPHAQFTRLREAGQWARMQDVIRSREMTLQGSLNPNLADHGDISEARQYSGRPVEPDWKPPFAPESPAPAAGRCPIAHGSPDKQP